MMSAARVVTAAPPAQQLGRGARLWHALRLGASFTLCGEDAAGLRLEPDTEFGAGSGRAAWCTECAEVLREQCAAAH